MISGRNGTSRTWEGTGYSQRSSRDIATHSFGGAGHCKTYNIREKQHIRKNSGGESANLEEARYPGETAHPDNSTVLLLLALVFILLPLPAGAQGLRTFTRTLTRFFFTRFRTRARTTPVIFAKSAYSQELMLCDAHRREERISNKHHYRNSTFLQKRSR